MDGKPCGHRNGWTDGRTDGRTDRAERPPGGTAGPPPPGSERTGWGRGREGRSCAKIAVFDPRAPRWGRDPMGTGGVPCPTGVPRVSHGCPVQLRTPGLAQEWGTWSCMGAAMGRSRCRLHGNVAPLDPRSISPPPAALHPSHPLHGEGGGGVTTAPPPHPHAGIPQKGAREPTANGSALVSAPTRPTKSWGGEGRGEERWGEGGGGVKPSSVAVGAVGVHGGRVLAARAAHQLP